MNPTKQNYFYALSAVFFTVFVISCGYSNQESHSVEKNGVDKTQTGSGNMGETWIPETDDSRKMICSANLECGVKDVMDTESSIRKLTIEKGGFIELSEVVTDKRHLSRVDCSRDSVMEYSLQSARATMIVRVPDDSLQLVLDEISGYAERVEKKVLKAEDVSLGILANQFTINRNVDSSKDKVSSGRRADSLAYDADQAVLSGLDLMDKVNYSTVQISLKEDEYVVAGMTMNVDALRAKSSPFWLRIVDSLAFGWNMLETIVVFLFRFWAVFVLMFLIYLAYKKWMPLSRFLSLNKQG